MSSQPDNLQDAETRFRQAFERLKAGTPVVLPPGTPVSQNNVAREAARDPTALKKHRFPVLVAAIQTYCDIQNQDQQVAARKATRRNAARRSLKEQLHDANNQRDAAQSRLTTANLRIVELSAELAELKRELGDGSIGRLV